MFIRDIGRIRALLGALPETFVGVGMTAFSRILPASFLDQYRIVALHKSDDLNVLREKANIFCLGEEAQSSEIAPVKNSETLLLNPRTGAFLDGISHRKNLFLYQDYPGLRSVADKKGWRLLANPPALRLRAVKRRFFKEMAATLGLPQAPGGLYPMGALHQKGYKDWVRLLGPALVVQLPDIETGGGRGTFFVRSGEEYRQLQARLKKNRWRDTKLSTVSVHKFLKGIPSSVVICVTRHGTLVSSLQRQLLDLPYCDHFAEDGVFCGHAWGAFPWSERAGKSAFKQACRIGDYLGTLGYKGILGIDFIVEGEKVYPIEINPRLTGALPMLSMLHMAAGVIPLEAFHMLEFLNIPYRMDPRALNSRYAETVYGSHLLLFCPQDMANEGPSVVKAGLYEHDPSNGAFHFLREAFEYADIRNERQFIVTDGPSLPDTSGTAEISRDSHKRLCRLLFSYPVVDHKGELLPRALSAANWVLSKTTEKGRVS